MSSTTLCGVLFPFSVGFYLPIHNIFYWIRRKEVVQNSEASMVNPWVRASSPSLWPGHCLVIMELLCVRFQLRKQTMQPTTCGLNKLRTLN